MRVYFWAETPEVRVAGPPARSLTPVTHSTRYLRLPPIESCHFCYDFHPIWEQESELKWRGASLANLFSKRVCGRLHHTSRPGSPAEYHNTWIPCVQQRWLSPKSLFSYRRGWLCQRNFLIGLLQSKDQNLFLAWTVLADLSCSAVEYQKSRNWNNDHALTPARDIDPL